MWLQCTVVSTFVGPDAGGAAVPVFVSDSLPSDAQLISLANAFGLPDVVWVDESGSKPPRALTPGEVLPHLSVRGEIAASFVRHSVLGERAPSRKELVTDQGSGVLRCWVSRSLPQLSAASDDIQLSSLGVDAEHVFMAGPDVAAVVTPEQLRDAQPSMAAVADLPGRGLALTARGDGGDFDSRFLMPPDIPEDSVTGSVNVALARFWSEQSSRVEFTARQRSLAGGVVRVRLEEMGAQVGGDCRALVSGGLIRI